MISRLIGVKTQQRQDGHRSAARQGAQQPRADAAKNKSARPNDTPPPTTTDNSASRFMVRVTAFLSITSLVISLITFALQFIAHDNISYLLPDVVMTTWPDNHYITISLNVFNGGNRPAALISATVDRTPLPRNLNLTNMTTNGLGDGECPTKPYHKGMHVFPLFEVTHGTTANPLLASVSSGASSGASVEPGKLFTETLLFKIFYPNSTGSQDVSGLICLTMMFADSDGNIYNITRALEAIDMKFQPPNWPSEREELVADWLQDDKSRVPIIIIDNRHFELPF